MENQLTFTIKESVLFQRNQEIDDILSIALEPDIVVEEVEDYVSITGSLQLRGTFRLNTSTESAEEQDESLEEQMSIRFVKEVQPLTDETAEFRHEFPVEITIPSNRVTDTNEIYVVVNSFDYELPNEQSLQLMAELGISGIEEEKPEPVSESHNVPILEEVPLRTEEPEDKLSLGSLELSTFEVEVKQQVEEESEVVVNEVVDEAVEDVTEIEETIRENEPVEENVPQYELKGRPQEDELPDDEVVRDENKSTEEDIVEDIKEESISAPEDVEGENERKSIEEETEAERDENTLFLTKMLAREEGEQFSKLRMRIIQPGDSLDSIAETYNVSLSHLVKTNRLEDHTEVEEGQILYIPMTTESDSQTRKID